MGAAFELGLCAPIRDPDEKENESQESGSSQERKQLYGKGC